METIITHLRATIPWQDHRGRQGSRLRCLGIERAPDVDIDLLIYLDVNRDGLDVEVEVDGFIVDLIYHKYII